jgi:single-strand DNA-binding protein
MINVNFNGRLGADAELKTSKNGKQFISMRVATDEFRNGEKGTAWMNVTYHGDRAIKMQEYLKKGNAVTVMGVETVSTYQNRNGETMVSRDVIADRVEFVNLGKSGETQSNDAVTDTGKFEPKTTAAEMATATAATDTDDLPF